nr:hypothetical protein [Oceanibium sediminis]
MRVPPLADDMRGGVAKGVGVDLREGHGRNVPRPGRYYNLLSRAPWRMFRAMTNRAICIEICIIR